MGKSYLDQFIDEIQNLEVKYSANGKNEIQYDVRFEIEPMPGEDYLRKERLSLIHYFQPSTSYKSKMRGLQENAMKDIIKLPIDQINYHIKLLKQFNIRYSVFWKWYNEISKSYKQSDSDYIDLITDLSRYFIIPELEEKGPYSKDFIQDLHEVVTIKQSHLIAFISQVNTVIADNINNIGRNTIENNQHNLGSITNTEIEFNLMQSKSGKERKMFEILVDAYKSPYFALTEYLSTQQKESGFSVDVFFKYLSHECDTLYSELNRNYLLLKAKIEKEFLSQKNIDKDVDLKNISTTDTLMRDHIEEGLVILSDQWSYIESAQLEISSQDSPPDLYGLKTYLTYAGLEFVFEKLVLKHHLMQSDKVNFIATFQDEALPNSWKKITWKGSRYKQYSLFKLLSGEYQAKLRNKYFISDSKKLFIDQDKPKKNQKHTDLIIIVDQARSLK